jgi:hypothetical protein
MQRPVREERGPPRHYEAARVELSCPTTWSTSPSTVMDGHAGSKMAMCMLAMSRLVAAVTPQKCTP